MSVLRSPGGSDQTMSAMPCWIEGLVQCMEDFKVHAWVDGLLHTRVQRLFVDMLAALY